MLLPASHPGIQVSRHHYLYLTTHAELAERMIHWLGGFPEVG